MSLDNLHLFSLWSGFGSKIVFFFDLSQFLFGLSFMVPTYDDLFSYAVSVY